MTSNLYPTAPQPGGIRMFCADCGTDRTITNAAADPGPCLCGSTMRVSAPLLGKVSSGDKPWIGA